MQPLFCICSPLVGVYSLSDMAGFGANRGIFEAVQKILMKIYTVLNLLIFNFKKIYSSGRKVVFADQIGRNYGQDCGFCWSKRPDSASLSQSRQQQAAQKPMQNRLTAIWRGLIKAPILAPLVAIGLAVMPAHMAQGQNSLADFSFKRVGPPQAGKRITVQIDPAEQARLLSSLPKVEIRREGDAPIALPIGPSAAYEWYWDLVDPARGQVAGRYSRALSALSQGPRGAQVAAPRLQEMQGLASAYGTEILKATIGTQVSPALVLAVMGIESGGKIDALSPKGAQGLMQLIAATAARFGVTDAGDPAQNIKGGVAYLNWLMGEFDRDPVMVLAAYNAGEGAVTANDGVPPYAETRDYVPKVLAAWRVAQGLCASPPELVTDPCVFKVIAAG